jgi:hypothetical protein
MNYDTTTKKKLKKLGASGSSYYNPRYSGGRDQEGFSSKPALDKAF